MKRHIYNKLFKTSSKDYFRTTVTDGDQMPFGEDGLKDGGLGMAQKTRKHINYDNLSKEEAIKVFQGMLSDLGVSNSWKWEDVNRVILDEGKLLVRQRLGIDRAPHP